METAAETTMRTALGLFAIDPPDTEFQQGYLVALMVFANEGLGFKWDDPSLARCEGLLSDKPAAALGRKKFDVIEGGKS